MNKLSIKPENGYIVLFINNDDQELSIALYKEDVEQLIGLLVDYLVEDES